MRATFRETFHASLHASFHVTFDNFIRFLVKVSVFYVSNYTLRKLISEQRTAICVIAKKSMIGKAINLVCFLYYEHGNVENEALTYS